MRRALSMLANGSASRISTSAACPVATEPRSVKPKPLAAHWLRSDVHTAVGEHCIGQFPRTAAHLFDSRHRNPDYRFNRPISVQYNGDNLANRIYYTSSNFGSQVENQVAPGAAPTGLLTVSFAY